MISPSGKPLLCVDKNILDGFSYAEVALLQQSYSTCIPGAATREILSSSEKKRIPKMAAKLPTGIGLCFDLAALEKEEILTTQLQDIFASRFCVRTGFNSWVLALDGRDDTWVPYQDPISKAEGEIEETFLEIYDLWKKICETDYCHETTPAAILQRIYRESEFTTILKDLRGNSPVSLERLGEQSVFYRKIQVWLVYQTQFLIGQSDPRKLSRKTLTNHLYDMYYVTLGALVGGFASSDKRPLDVYRKICPEGLWITKRTVGGITSFSGGLLKTDRNAKTLESLLSKLSHIKSQG